MRKNTLVVLTHLILDDMIKVKGQISELATCIVDADESIAGHSKLFFFELARKVDFRSRVCSINIPFLFVD